MEELAKKRCIPCAGGVDPLAGDTLEALSRELGHDWEIVDGRRLAKTFSFDDFASALAFVNRVGVMADAEDHHPDIHLSWGKARVEIWTHTINGLTESDFVFAAKAETFFAG